MHDEPRATLQQIIARYGATAYENSRRCEALLRDLSSAYEREIFVLVSALEAGVVHDLLSLRGQVPPQVILAQVTAQIRESLALTEEAARWAVESWAVALDVIAKVPALGPVAPTTSAPPSPVPTPLRTLDAHPGGVTGIAFSPDGHRLASVGLDATARLWDLATGNLLHQLGEQFGVLNAVAFSPDGRWAALGSSDCGVYLWELDKPHRRARRLRGHTAGVTSVAFSPVGNDIASGSRDATLRLWDMDTGQETQRLAGHTDAVLDIAFSPTGQLLASAGGWDKTVRLWDPQAGREVRQLVGHTAQVTCVAFDPTGRTLASGGWDETIRLWNPTTGQEQRQLTTPGEAVGVIFDVSFSPDGQTLASGGWDAAVHLWQAATGRSRGTWAAHTGIIHQVAFAPDGQLLASAGKDGALRWWKID